MLKSRTWIKKRQSKATHRTCGNKSPIVFFVWFPYFIFIINQRNKYWRSCEFILQLKNKNQVWLQVIIMLNYMKRRMLVFFFKSYSFRRLNLITSGRTKFKRQRFRYHYDWSELFFHQNKKSTIDTLRLVWILRRVNHVSQNYVFQIILIIFM